MADWPSKEQIDRIKARVLQSLTVQLDAERIDYDKVGVDIQIWLATPPVEITVDFKPNRG
jgi:hypothetical protein